MADPILELSTLAPTRPTIEIDDATYELAVADDLSLEDQQFMYSRGKRVGELMELPKMAASQAKELKMIVDRMLHTVLRDLPDEVSDKLSAMQKIQVINAFMQASPQLKAALEEAKQDGQSTTEK